MNCLSKNTEKNPNASHPPSCQLPEADFICSTERKMTKRWVRTVNIAAVIAEGVWCERKLRLQQKSVGLLGLQPFFHQHPLPDPPPPPSPFMYYTLLSLMEAGRPSQKVFNIL